MKLVGIAIIGKSNEPMYLCDCERVDQFVDDGSATVSAAAAAAAATATTTAPNDDYFGFGLTVDSTSSKTQGQSLSIEHQLLLHASLDPLEEMIGASKLDGSMPLRRNTNYSSWLGLLTTLDGSWAVYGQVSATNIKFLALCGCDTTTTSGGGNDDDTSSSAQSPWVESFLKTTTSSSSSSSLTSNPWERKVKKLLAAVHKHYADYIMNPFSKPAEPILHSPNFDEQIRQSIAQYNDREDGGGGPNAVVSSSGSYNATTTTFFNQ